MGDLNQQQHKLQDKRITNEKFEDTKGVLRSRKSKIPRGYSEVVNERKTDDTMAKKKRQSTENYTENKTLSITDITENTGMNSGE